MYKEEFSNIYLLLWAMHRIAKGHCDLNGLVSGDLMHDAISVHRMNSEDNIRYWHIDTNSTWITSYAVDLYKNIYVIRYNEGTENIYSIEQIK